ncbi:MAG: 50S ribosomal protein L17 [Candidatus Margulisiibacteriota bacterium]
MRHRRGNAKLGRPTDQRLAMIRSLVKGLFENGRIETTVDRAKAARRVAEQLVTLGKKGDLTSRRRALQILPNADVVKLIFAETAPRFSDRPGGYTRIVRTGFRRGDAAEMSLLEFVA